MEDPTLPPPGARTSRNMLRWLLAWSQVHTVATAAILGFLAGWLLPKIAGWLL